METQNIKSTKDAIKHWYLSLILGIIFILTGLWVLRTPVESYITLAILFSVIFFVSGIFEIIYYTANRKEVHHWGWGLASGIIDLLFGIWLLSSPLVSISILPFFVGFMLMFRSMTAVAVSFDLKHQAVKGWGWLLALGILGWIFSFIMIWDPLIGGMTIVIWTGVALISIGAFRVMLAFRLKGLNHK
jgi:uncharacterized membrane protein HdeD (DUF308 family)